MRTIKIGDRQIGPDFQPLVIADIGINHEGSFEKAIQMIDDAALSGCECVKFQCHIVNDEMAPAAKNVIPGNADVSIWEIMERCSLSKEEEVKLKQYTESKGMIYLSTPFSRAAANRLEKIGLNAYKIGSGECNNYPLVEHIAKFAKPIILSTGMNEIQSVKKSVDILEKYKVPFAILHCTSVYPTPYELVRLNAIKDLEKAFPNIVLGLSDHSPSIYPCLGAVSLGASILEKHFTSRKDWPGPDIPISMDPDELKELINGANIIHRSLKGCKTILKEEKPTIDFAYACVVAIRNINKGDLLTEDNIWVKRPGTGEIKAEHFNSIVGKTSNSDISIGQQLKWSDIRK